ncbi:MAG TPA: hypothetical protein VJT08_01050 [Terriglobales bacterium]|nr:hypothetical protein [Terriglobales bacterium]
MATETHLENGDYFADVLQAHGTPTEPFWYYVIQRKNSNVVIDLVRFNTRDEEVDAAQRALTEFAKRIAATAD